MKNTFLFTLIIAGVVLASCSTTECIGGACAEVDTTFKYNPTEADYVAQAKKATKVSQKGAFVKKAAVKKDTVVIVQKVIVKEVVKEVAPKKETAKPKVFATKKQEAKKNEAVNVEAMLGEKDLNGVKPYNPILFR